MRWWVRTEGGLEVLVTQQLGSDYVVQREGRDV
jgi:hypothetical protein